MAVHIHTAQGGRAIGSHMPLDVALAVVPNVPRPLLVRLVARAIDRLDEIDGDRDLEPEVTEQDDEPEVDDEPEEDDPGGGNVEDRGEASECGHYGEDQRETFWPGAAFRLD